MGDGATSRVDWQAIAAIGWIAVGGGVGSVMRYLVAQRVQQWATVAAGPTFPYGTLTVNVLGSLILGFLWFALTNASTLAPPYRAGILVGLLGGFTTYSTFALDSVNQLDDGQFGRLATYLLITNVGAILAALVGVRLAQRIYGVT